MSTLFTNEKPKPYGEYPSRDAYILLVVLGLIPFASFITAPVFAYKWPGGGWRLGLWAASPMVVFTVLNHLRQLGPPVGLIASVTDPGLWIVAVGSCLLARAGARMKLERAAKAER